MSQDQTAPDNRTDYITQIVSSLKQRTRRALSPWVQRQLKLSGLRPPERARTVLRRPTRVTSGHPSSLVQHLQRAVERTTAWRPSVGSLSPVMVQRFAHSVANRIQPIGLVGAGRQVQGPQMVWGEEVELTLPTGPAPAGPARDELAAGTRIGGPSTFTVGQRIPPMSVTPPTSPRAPRAAPPTPRRVQRRVLPPDARLFSRVEEVPKSEPISPAAEPSTETPIQAEPESEAARPMTSEARLEETEVERQPSLAPQERGPALRREAKPPPVQRKEQRDVPTRPAPGEPPAREAPQPPESELAADSATQRREELEMPLQVELPEEVPPDQPERQPEPERRAAPPIIQRAEEPGKPPGGRLPEMPSPAPERESERPPDVGPLPIQRGTEPEMPLHAGPPEPKEPEPPGRIPEPRREAQPPSVQREAEPEKPRRSEPSVPGMEVPSEPVPEPRRAAEPPSVQREAAPEVPEPPRQEPETLPMGKQPPAARKTEPEEPAIRRETEPQGPVRGEPSDAAVAEPAEPRPEPRRRVEPDALPHLEPTASRPEPGLEVRPGLEPPPVQRREEPGRMPPTVDRPESAAPQAGAEPEADFEIEVPPVQREEEPETPLRSDMPLRQPVQPEEGPGKPPAEPAAPSGQRMDTAERPLPPRPEAGPEVSEQMAQPRRVAGQVPPVQREEAPEMPLRVLPETKESPEREVESRAPSIQREVEPALPPEVSPIETMPPEPRRTGEQPRVQRREEPAVPPRPEMPLRAPGRPEPAPGEPKVQRKEEPARPMQVPPPRAETPEPEAAAPQAMLGKDVLARAISRARVSLSRVVSPATRRTAGTRSIGMERQPQRGERIYRQVTAIQRGASSTPLYLRTPEKRVGPDLSLTVSRLRAGRPIQRRPAGALPGIEMPVSAQDPLQAFLASWQGPREQPMVLPPVPPRPARSSAAPVVQTKPTVAEPRETRRPEQPFPLTMRPLAPQPAATQVVQREAEPPDISHVSEAPTVSGTIVQRAEGEESEDVTEELDLADLAQRIYPLVKRLLAIERERRSSW